MFSFAVLSYIEILMFPSSIKKQSNSFFLSFLAIWTSISWHWVLPAAPHPVLSTSLVAGGLPVGWADPAMGPWAPLVLAGK